MSECQFADAVAEELAHTGADELVIGRVPDEEFRTIPHPVLDEGDEVTVNPRWTFVLVAFACGLF